MKKTLTFHKVENFSPQSPTLVLPSWNYFPPWKSTRRRRLTNGSNPITLAWFVLLCFLCFNSSVWSTKTLLYFLCACVGLGFVIVRIWTLFVKLKLKSRMRGSRYKRRCTEGSSTARFTSLVFTSWELFSTPSPLPGNPICLVRVPFCFG